MPDNWGFVVAAYGLTALVLGLYWRRLVRRERDLHRMTRSATRAGGTTTSAGERSRQPSRSGHPRSEPASRPPLQ